jgi:hypothetical protein
MTDVSVYYFVRHGGPGGEELLSERRATLATSEDSAGYWPPRPQIG